MSQNGTSRFRVECPECDVQHESDVFDAAMNFIQKHRDHTQHDMKWIKADFEGDIGLKRTALEVTCDVCEENWQFEEIEAAQDFRQEHEEYTDHGIPNSPEEVEVDLLNGEHINRESVKEMIKNLEDRFNLGVPVGVIYAQFRSSGPDVKKVKNEIEGLKRKGVVYEPKRGYLLTA